MLNVLDLFSGIGGFSLGLERTGGFLTAAFCEIDPFCRRVLANHWPGVPIYDDVCTLTADALSRDGITVDVICGGFPCQDVSVAGKRAGLEGARSGLWGEYRRIIGEVRPKFVIVENVPGLLSSGMGTVLGDMAALGYDAQWDCIPASAVGAPHRRDRVWIVAHAVSDTLRKQPGRRNGSRRTGATQPPEYGPQGTTPDTATLQRQAIKRDESDGDVPRSGELADATRQLRNGAGSSRETRRVQYSDGSWWAVEPDVGRVASRVPSRVDRLRALGNAVVPQVVECIGNAILKANFGSEDVCNAGRVAE